jgi:hypothetical protein
VSASWFRRAVVVVLTATAIAAFVVVPSQAAGRTTCAATFSVLHNDRIGRLQLPQGAYRIAVSGMSCQTASTLFAEFLQDYDGVLSKPWTYTIQGVGKGTFTSGRGKPSFTVSYTGRRATGNGGGRLTGIACPFPFHVLHNDRVGPLPIPAGYYRLTRLGPRSPSCSASSTLFTRFLQDFDGRLPGGWRVVAAEGAFVRGSLTYGFRIKRWAGRLPSRFGSPRPRDTRCPGTFRVLHNDRIGPLRFPAGPYYLNILTSSRGLTCANTVQLFRAFLDRPDGSLPRPWVIDAQTGTFRRGRGSGTGFRAKPAFFVRG